MSLTSRLSLAVSIDTLGHAVYYEKLFLAANLRCTELTFSGLRSVTRRKERRRIHQGLKTVRLDRRIVARTKMIEGVAKQEKDVKEGRAYASGIGLEVASDATNDLLNEKRLSGEPTIKKKRANTETEAYNNNKRTTSSTCKCGGRDHKRVSSKDCPWKGLSKDEISKKCAERKVSENVQIMQQEASM